MGKSQQSRSQHQQDLDLARSKRRDRIVEGAIALIFHAIDKLPVPVCIVMVAWFVFGKATENLAGKDTDFKMVLEAIFAAGIDRWLYLLACGILGGGWYVERRLKRRYIERHSGYVKELEELNDPDRTGSGLTGRGEPP